MAVFPAEEVERIINEEIVRGQGNTLWTKPQARRRYQKLLATLVLGKRARHDGLGDLLDSVFDAQYELSPYCSERERLFAFELDAVRRLSEVQELVHGVIGRTLSAQIRWPADAVMPHDQGFAFLHTQFEQLNVERAQVQLAGVRGGTVALHSSRVITLDQSLQVCRYLLMTHAETLEFDEHYNVAQSLLRRSSPLFNMPEETTVN